MLRPLLKEVRRYADMETAPGCRDGCGDCEVVGKVVGRWAGLTPLEYGGIAATCYEESRELLQFSE